MSILQNNKKMGGGHEKKVSKLYLPDSPVLQPVTQGCPWSLNCKVLHSHKRSSNPAIWFGYFEKKTKVRLKQWQAIE